jgi:hypothetical protein
MDRFFLKIKHWQLILLPFVVSLMYMLGIQHIFTETSVYSRSYTPVIVLNPAILYLIFILFWYGWIYSTGKNLHRKLPPTVKMNLGAFEVRIYLIFICMLALCIFIPFMSVRRLYPRGYSDATFLFMVLAMFISLILAVILSFRCRYFVIRALRAVEKQEAVKFSQFAIDFLLMILFLPLGIIKLQPRVNKLFKEEPDTSKVYETNPLIKWSVSLVFMLSGLVLLVIYFNHSKLLITGIPLILVGIMLLPPVSNMIQDKFGIDKRRHISYTSVILLCLCSMLFFNMPHTIDRASRKANKTAYYNSDRQPLNKKETRLIKKVIHHEKVNVCLKALNKITDQNMLLNVAIHSRHIDVRHEALKRLTSQNLFTEILKRKNYTEIHFAALKRITDQNYLAVVAKECDNSNIRIKALRKIKDQDIIASLARNDPDSKVRIEALTILTDKSAIAEVARNDPEYEIRQIAYKRLGLQNSQDALYDIFQNDPTGWVRNDAFDMLTDRKILREIAVNDGFYGRKAKEKLRN